MPSLTPAPAPAAATAGDPAQAVADYVRAAARFMDLPLDEAQIGRVAVHLGRTRAMVDALRQLPLTPEDEPPEIFVAAPFPSQDPR